MHLEVLHQLFAVVKALEDLDMDLVLTQLAPSGWLLDFPDKKLPLITCRATALIFLQVSEPGNPPPTLPEHSVLWFPVSP